MTSGDALPPVPASLDNGFVTLTKTGTHPTTVTKDVTVTYNATWNGPFEFTKTEASAKWYNMHIRRGWYVTKQDFEPYYPQHNVGNWLKAPAYQWAFGGDPYHVKVYNRTTGLSETLTKDGDNAVMRSGDYTWDLLPNSDGFVLRVTGTENSCINQLGGIYGPLQFWTDDNSPKDDGSTFRVVEAEVEIEEPSSLISFADSNVKALCIANWDTNGSGELSKAEAAAVTDLGEVFTGNTTITSFNELQYFTGLTYIGKYVFEKPFSGCSKLSSVTIPESVTSIGKYAFEDCKALTSINIPSSVTSIGSFAFCDCSSLTSVAIPSGVTTINKGTFTSCSKLSSVTIPESVTSIGDHAFSYSGLTSIIIPKNVISIGKAAFGWCPWKNFYCYAEDVPSTDSEAFASSRIYSATLHVPAASVGAYRTTEPWSQFKKIIAIIDYTCGDNLTWTFDDATGTLTISGTGEMYDYDDYPAPWDEFKDQIMQIDISDGVTSIGNGAFRDLQYVTSITIPISVTRIGAEAFSGMIGLTEFFCYTRDIPSTVSNTFSGLNLGSVTLRVLANLVNLFKASPIWNLFGSILGLGETVTFNGSDAKLSTVWYADRSMEPRSGFEEMHAVHYQPGNTDRSGDGSSVNNNKVFVFNLLSGFKGGAVKAGDKELTIVFNREKYANGITQTGLSGKTYTMTATDSIVSATRNGETKPVVKLMDTYKNKAGRWMEFQNNDFANDLHNAYPIFNPDGKTTDAFYTEMTLADTKNIIPVNITGDTDFRVRYLRPMDINHVHQGKAYLKDAAEAGYDIMSIANLFDFTDWRKFPFGYNTSERFDWVNFFGIKDIYFNLDEVETDRDGIMEKLEDPNLSLVQIPENRSYHKFSSREDFWNSIGYIRYQNNGGAVATYNLFIPFHIVHNWGEIVKKVQVPIVGTFDDETNIRWLDEETIATNIELNHTSLELQGIGSKIQLIATVSPEIANQEVTWRSTDVTVVTVDDDGLVTAVGIGTAQVIATTTDGSNLTASCLIDVIRGDYVLGDVNGDSDVNSADVMSIYSIIAGRSLLDRSLGDVTGEGDVNSADVMRVYSIMAGKYPIRKK